MGEQAIVGPTSHFYVSQRLKMHYVDWGNEGKPLLVIVHGTLDHARSFDWVAKALRDDYHVVAPDLRGHGDSAWAVGGDYSMIGYVTDLEQLLAQINAFPAVLLGHSLGAGIVLQYAGVYPQHVVKVVAVEGLGPTPRRGEHAQRPTHERIQQWITHNHELAARNPRRYKTLDEAVKRTLEQHTRFSPEQAKHITAHGLARNEDGTYSWKYDNYVRAARMAYPYHEDDTSVVWSRITAPTLLVNGEQSFAVRGEDERTKAFPNARSVTIPDASHWVHHDQLAVFLKVVRDFLGVREGS
ncbi:MAG: alpha/beta hydrolase [Dehalococcoidia bacterium]|nr:alpha/beta hydrolase [Dehalococcoidia bacterium]